MLDTSAISPVKRSRISQQIVVQLCEMIRTRQVHPGDRLPPERELVERFQVSRTSLREALRALEIAGILDARQGGGTFVREAFDIGMLSPLSLVLDAGTDIVGDLWEVRIIFEPDIASRAALRAGPDEISTMEQHVREQERCLERGETNDYWLESDHAFHTAVARASRNEAAVRVIGLINELLRSGRGHFGTSDARRIRAFTAHREILDSIRERDPAAARESMLRHLREVEGYILEGVVSGTHNDTTTAHTA